MIVAKSPYYDYDHRDIEWLTLDKKSRITHEINKIYSDSFGGSFGGNLSRFGPDNAYLTKAKLANGAFNARTDLVKVYSWAIPCPEAIRAIIDLGCKVIEIGAGNGYWASLAKGQIDCFDVQPWKNSWHPVKDCIESDSMALEDRYRQTDGYDALFLCWPPYDEPMATNYLKAFKGRYLIYVGEGWGGCTADDTFFKILKEEWTEIKEVEIPRWSGLHDHFWIYERNVIEDMHDITNIDENIDDSVVVCVVEEQDLIKGKDKYNKIKDWLYEMNPLPPVNKTTHWIQMAGDRNAVPIFLEDKLDD